MTARIIGGLVYDLDDKPVRADFSRGFDGVRQQQLALGDETGSCKLSISLTTTSVEGVDDLIEALHMIRADKVRQDQVGVLHYDKVPDPADGCHWCACGNRWPCKQAAKAVAA